MWTLTVTIRRIATAALVVALVLGASGPADAATPNRDGAAVKAELLGVVADLETVLAAPTTSPGILEGLVEAETQLRGLPPASFQDLDPMLLDGLVRLRDLAATIRAERADPPLFTEVASTGFPAADYPNISFDFVLQAAVGVPDENGASSGSGFGFCTAAMAPNPELRFTLLNAGLLGEALRDTARRLCDQTVIIAGEGANLAPVCIISDIAYILIRAIQDNQFLCAGVMLGAETTATYGRLGHVHDDLVAAETLLAADVAALETHLVAAASSNQDLLHVLGADLEAHDHNLDQRMQDIMDALAEIHQFLADFRALELRIRIEANLADADGKPVGDFMLPQSLGGFLETVREVTADTIQMVVDSGGDVGNAVTLLAKGDRLLLRGDFGGAYDAFGAAYRAASR